MTLLIVQSVNWLGGRCQGWTSFLANPFNIQLILKVLKDESGKNTINLTELEQSFSCPLTPRLTQSV